MAEASNMDTSNPANADENKTMDTPESHDVDANASSSMETNRPPEPTLLPAFTTKATISKAKILKASDCVLYRFPPEMRKCIFQAVIGLFFREHPRRQDIILGLDRFGNQSICPPRPVGYYFGALNRDRAFAGLWADLLPPLEMALFLDTALHNEFITTRIEKSTLNLEPEVLADYEIGYGFDRVVWPSAYPLNKPVRHLLRSVTYSLDVGMLYDEDAEPDEPGVDRWERMRRLGKALVKLSGVGHIESWAELCGRVYRSQAKSRCGALPLLEKVIIRFPNSCREYNTGNSYKMFEADRWLFFRAVKKFVSECRIKSFQLEDLRDFKIPGPAIDPDEAYEMEPLGLMSEVGPLFGTFSDDLDDAFGVEGEHWMVIHQEDPEGNGEGWEIYKATQTWTAPGQFLTWNDAEKLEEELVEPFDDSSVDYGLDDDSLGDGIFMWRDDDEDPDEDSDLDDDEDSNEYYDEDSDGYLDIDSGDEETNDEANGNDRERFGP